MAISTLSQLKKGRSLGEWLSAPPQEASRFGYRRVTIELDASRRSQDVILVLSRLMRLVWHTGDRSDNDAEFAAATVMRWLRDATLIRHSLRRTALGKTASSI